MIRPVRFINIFAVFMALLLFSAIYGCGPAKTRKLAKSGSDLVSDSLPRAWDQAFPLGNATVGVLVWQRDSMLRLSLDRTDLWDLRPNDSLSGPDFNFDWVKDNLRSETYNKVQAKLDTSYNNSPYPTKIPGAALEFSLRQLGKPTSVRLYIKEAVCEIIWPNGTRFLTFVAAEVPDIGWFRFENLPDSIELKPTLVPPLYQEKKDVASGFIYNGYPVSSLGYPQGEVVADDHTIRYRQKGYGSFTYDVAATWDREGSVLEGVWSVTSSLARSGCYAPYEVETAIRRGFEKGLKFHSEFWNKFWAKSSITVPDSIIQKQYDRDIYKLGSASRPDSYPISMQAIWTRDNGCLPPWKGDYHYTMKVPMCYLPVFASNHLDQGLSLINTLWEQRDNFKRYTSIFFGKDGLNVPGAAALNGDPMGGWAQYAMSQTTGAWLARFFWLHWKYTGDNTFLLQKAYPFAMEVAQFLENQSFVDEHGVRRLEYSSTPEVYTNTPKGWFTSITNYDLALMKSAFSTAAEMADSLKRPNDARRWRRDLSQLPDFDVDDEEGGLTFANATRYAASNRTLSNALAIYPLSQIDASMGEKESSIISGTINRIDRYGSIWWVGYSFALDAGLHARAGRGDRAAEDLRIFAECFCLPNSFHANGDQSGTGKSKMTYNPFTLDGNFAFAAALQEMMIQSHTGVVNVFPAIPLEWKDVSFTDLRAMGGLLVSATRSDGKLNKLKVTLDKDAKPSTFTIVSPDTTVISLTPGQSVTIKE